MSNFQAFMFLYTRCGCISLLPFCFTIWGTYGFECFVLAIIFPPHVPVERTRVGSGVPDHELNSICYFATVTDRILAVNVDKWFLSLSITGRFCFSWVWELPNPPTEGIERL